MTRRQLISIFFVLLLLAVLYNVVYILSPFIDSIFWAAVLAFAFYPLYLHLLPLTRRNGNVAAALCTAVILLAFTPLLAYVSVLAVREAVHFFEKVSAWVQSGQAEDFFENLRHLPLIRRFSDAPWLQWENLQSQLDAWAAGSAGTLGNAALKHATVLTKNVLQGFFSFFLAFFILFFFLKDGDKIYDFVRDNTPLDEGMKKEIFQQLSDTFSATLYGQVFTALAQGAALGVVFWMLNLPLPFFFAAFTFLASMIPIFGAAMVWVPFVFYLGFTHEYGRAVALFGLGVFFISGIDNLLKPLIIGHKTKLPYPLLFLGILGGLQVYGMMGIFLAPAVLSLFFVLIRIYRSNFPEQA